MNIKILELLLNCDIKKIIDDDLRITKNYALCFKYINVDYQYSGIFKNGFVISEKSKYIRISGKDLSTEKSDDEMFQFQLTEPKIFQYYSILRKFDDSFSYGFYIDSEYSDFIMEKISK